MHSCLACGTAEIVVLNRVWRRYLAKRSSLGPPRPAGRPVATLRTAGVDRADLDDPVDVEAGLRIGRRDGRGVRRLEDR